MARRFLVLAVALLALVPQLASAQANSAVNAVSDAFPGQVFTPFVNDTNPNAWFRYELRAGRSYCAEAGAFQFAAGDTSPGSRDAFVTVYAANGTTVLTSSDDASQEPDSQYGSRACFIATANGLHFMTVRRFGTTGPVARQFNARLVESSSWASWFFIGGDYNSFVIMRNTTNSTVNYTINWRNPAGTLTGTTSGSVGGNGGIGLNARTFVTNPTVNFNGTVEIVHTGSPEALVGQVTSLSATTGIAYDSAFFQRKPW